MKYFLLFIIGILSLLWGYFSWKYLNITRLDSLTIIILLGGMFVFGVLFGKIPLLKERKKQQLSYKLKKNTQVNNKYITQIEPITYTTKSVSNIKEDNIIDNDFSNFDGIQDTSFLNISDNIKKQKKQDLKIIEGIGPKIEVLLNQNGIYSYKDLADSQISNIQNILNNAGKRYLMHNPKTWAKQAKLANKGDFQELEIYKKSLNKGIEV